MQEAMSAANKQVYSTTTSAGKKPKKCCPYTQLQLQLQLQLECHNYLESLNFKKQNLDHKSRGWTGYEKNIIEKNMTAAIRKLCIKHINDSTGYMIHKKKVERRKKITI